MIQDNQETVSLVRITDYIDVIWQRRIYFLVPFIAVPIITVIYIIFASVEYRVESSIFIDETYFNHPTLKDYNLTINLKDRLPTIEQQLTGENALLEILEINPGKETIFAELIEEAKERLAIEYIGPGLVSISYYGRNPRFVKKTVERAVDVYLKYALEPSRGIGKKLVERLKTRDRILSTQIMPKLNQALSEYQDAKRNFTELASEYTFAKDEYETWLYKYKRQEKIVEQQVDEIIPLKKQELDTSQIVQLIVPATIPQIPYKPQKGRLFLLSIVGGIMLGAFLVYVRQFFDDSIRSIADIEISLGVSVLGRIPELWGEEPKNGTKKTDVPDLKKGKSRTGFLKLKAKPTEKEKYSKLKGYSGKRKRGYKKAVLPLLVALCMVPLVLLVFGTSRRAVIVDKPRQPATLRYVEEMLLEKATTSKNSKGNIAFELNQKDVDAVFELASSKFSRGNATCTLLNDKLVFGASAELLSSPFKRYLNLQVISELTVEREEMHIDIDSVKAGFVRLPVFLISGFIRQQIENRVGQDKKLKRLLKAIRVVKVENSRLKVSHESSIALSDFFFIGSASKKGGISILEMEHMAKIYQILVNLAQNLSATDDQFRSIMETGFAEASRLADQGMSALKTNKIALYAIALYFGDATVQKTIDPDNKLQMYRMGADLLRPKAQIYNRSDWSQHFIISAMLTALFDRDTANRMGINKELRDLSGTGFSFSDIWADRCGTLFGQLILKDEDTAQRTQRDILQGFVIENYFPVPTDLPKNLSREEFESTYGSIESLTFKDEITEIDSKIELAPGYQGF